jgi:hypothetical protein
MIDSLIHIHAAIKREIERGELTSNRKNETYAAMFRCLNRTASRMNINFKSTTIVCDFEQAFINAVREQVHVSLVLHISLKLWFFIV